MITILAVGKKHEDWVRSGIERYEKRLRPPYDVSWALIPHSALQADSARQEESDRIRRRLPDDSFVILLDERGRRRTSPAFLELLQEPLARSRKVTIIIGGAYGVDDALHDRADMVVSLSDMVFPHQLVRLILIEQLYRAQSIAAGGKYHHE